LHDLPGIRQKYDLRMWLTRRRLSDTLARTAVSGVLVGACTGLVTLVGALGAWPAMADGPESIPHNDVHIEVRTSGELRIIETIEYDFGSNDRHGIVRVIPVRRPVDDSHDRVYRISDLSVTATGGASARFDILRQGVEERIRIGDPDRTQTGRHTYTIRYTVRGALDAVGDGVELRWNAIGTEWVVPTARTSVTVSGPADVIRASCVTGPTGSQERCTSVTSDGHTVSFTQDDLSPGRGVTIGVTYPHGSVDGVGPLLARRRGLAAFFPLTGTTGALGLGAALGGVLAALVLWRLARGPMLTRPSSRASADALCAEIRPAQAGLLRTGRLRRAHVAATLVDLAVRGHILIREAPRGNDRWARKNWFLTRLTSPSEDILGYERALLDGIFANSDTVSLTVLRQTIGARAVSFRYRLDRDMVERGWYRGSPNSIRRRPAPALLLVAGAGTAVLCLYTRVALVGVGVVVGLMALCAALWLRPPPSRHGRDMLVRVNQLRAYLAAVDMSSVPPGERVDVLGRYLPHAIALGVDPGRLLTAEPTLPVLPWYLTGALDRGGQVASHQPATPFGEFLNHAIALPSTARGHGGSGGGGGTSVDGGGVGGGGGGGGGGSW